MAYMMEVSQTCLEPGCNSRAVAEVFNARNSSHGKFCRRHARQKVNRLLVIESRDAPDCCHADYPPSEEER